MISILVHGPDFASSENLTRAFALWDDVQLISIHPSDWREYDEGLLVDNSNIEQAHDILNESDMLFLGDATSTLALAKVSPDVNWLDWARSKNIIAYFGDSAYFKHPQFYDGLCEELDIRRLFLLPNLMPLTKIEAVPLHHPMYVEETAKAEVLTIAHAPGRDGKAGQKGTDVIEPVINELQDIYEFEYVRIMYLTIEECLYVKGRAHIVIDQLPPVGVPFGLGRTGTEALAAGSAVITKLYDTSVLKCYFDPPPIIDVQEASDLELALTHLIEDKDVLTSVQEASLQWSKEVIAYKPWLEYVGKYI